MAIAKTPVTEQIQTNLTAISVIARQMASPPPSQLFQPTRQSVPPSVNSSMPDSSAATVSKPVTLSITVIALFIILFSFWARSYLAARNTIIRENKAERERTGAEKKAQDADIELGLLDKGKDGSTDSWEGSERSEGGFGDIEEWEKIQELRGILGKSSDGGESDMGGDVEVGSTEKKGNGEEEDWALSPMLDRYFGRDGVGIVGHEEETASSRLASPGLKGGGDGDGGVVRDRRIRARIEGFVDGVAEEMLKALGEA